MPPRRRIVTKRGVSRRTYLERVAGAVADQVSLDRVREQYTGAGQRYNRNDEMKHNIALNMGHVGHSDG
jgi:hypothetical protein